MRLIRLLFRCRHCSRGSFGKPSSRTMELSERSMLSNWFCSRGGREKRAALPLLLQKRAVAVAGREGAITAHLCCSQVLYGRDPVGPQVQLILLDGVHVLWAAQYELGREPSDDAGPSLGAHSRGLPKRCHRCLLLLAQAAISQPGARAGRVLLLWAREGAAMGVLGWMCCRRQAERRDARGRHRRPPSRPQQASWSRAGGALALYTVKIALAATIATCTVHHTGPAPPSLPARLPTLRAAHNSSFSCSLMSSAAPICGAGHGSQRQNAAAPLATPGSAWRRQRLQQRHSQPEVRQVWQQQQPSHSLRLSLCTAATGPAGERNPQNVDQPLFLPSPTLSAEEAARVQLEALQQNDEPWGNHGVQTMYEWANDVGGLDPSYYFGYRKGAGRTGQDRGDSQGDVDS